jgi:hypothetical protein
MLSTTSTSAHSKRRRRSNSSPHWLFPNHATIPSASPPHLSSYTQSLTLSKINTTESSTSSGSSTPPRKKYSTCRPVRHSHSKFAPSIRPDEDESLTEHQECFARSSSTEFKKTHFFSPAKTPPLSSPFTSRSTTQLPHPKKSASSPLLHSQVYAHRPIYPSHTTSWSLQHMSGDSGDDREDDSMIYTSWGTGSKYPSGVSTTGSGTSLSTRLFGGNSGGSSLKGPKSITTTPGQLGAGETETETDEPVSP